MFSTKICQFTQEDLEPSTVDVFGPNGGRALSVPRVPMNGSNEDFWSSAESLGRKKKKIFQVLPEVEKLTAKAMNEKRVGKIKKKMMFCNDSRFQDLLVRGNRFRSAGFNRFPFSRVTG